MKTPLPEVPPPVAKKRDFAKVPLPILSGLCAAQAVSWVLTLFLHTPDPEISRFWDAVLWAIVTGMSLLLTHFLWRGYRIARKIWLWVTAFSLPFYAFPSLLGEAVPVSRIEQTLSYFDFSLAVVWLVYLNLPNVKAHFAGRKTVE